MRAKPQAGLKCQIRSTRIASLLTDETLTLSNVPRLRDVAQLTQILSNHGVDYSVNGKRLGQNDLEGQTINLTAREIVDTTAPYELVSKMRASFWVIGPLVARMHEARVSLPGGCAIGARPVDLHLQALAAMGADLKVEQGYVKAAAIHGLKGAHINFSMPSVGATEHAMMAATLAEGETEIVNAACEPEVVDLAVCLNAMGARIEGAGTPTIRIQGVKRLHGAHPRGRAGPDRDRDLCDGCRDDRRRCRSEGRPSGPP
jgi:UDP-N-acetylglucosamine 1-carboxyvinyltransferase